MVRAFVARIGSLWRVGVRGKLAVGCSGLAALLLACVGCTAIVGPFLPEPTPTVRVATAPPTASVPPTVPIVPPAPSLVPPTATRPPTPAPTRTPLPTRMPPTATPDTLPRIGEIAEVNGVQLVVNSVTRADAIGQFLKAEPGRTFLTVAVTIENVEQSAHNYNPFWFKVRDTEGQEYGATIGGPDMLKAGELARGEKVKGTVTFSVKDDASGLILFYDTRPLAGRNQQIRVVLNE